VIAGAAGTVIVAVPFTAVSAFEVAVTVIVCAEEVAVGAVKVAEVLVVAVRSLLLLPPPLTVHVTPSSVPLVVLSWVTVAVRVTASPPSTVDDEAVTATLGLELPPQADSHTATDRTTQKRLNLFPNINSLQIDDTPM